MYFRKKQVVIEAVQFDGSEESIANILKLGASRLVDVDREERSLPKIQISTLEGKMTAKIGDYVIKGVHGELYPCKPDIFTETYEKCNEPSIMNFGQAIERLKQGKKVARAGWNGKGMWVVLMPALYLPPYNDQNTNKKVNDRTAKHIGEDKPLDSQPYFAMWTTEQKWQPGWLASQADMLAEDWQVVGD